VISVVEEQQPITTQKFWVMPMGPEPDAKVATVPHDLINSF
jgi:hypothetical protein